MRKISDMENVVQGLRLCGWRCRAELPEEFFLAFEGDGDGSGLEMSKEEVLWATFFSLVKVVTHLAAEVEAIRVGIGGVKSPVSDELLTNYVAPEDLGEDEEVN